MSQTLRPSLVQPRQGLYSALAVRPGLRLAHVYRGRRYLLIEGRYKVIQERPDGPVHLRTMGPGEIFGELALLLGNRRSAAVVAEETTTVLLIAREVLKQSGALDGWSSVLLEALAKRFADLERSVR